MQVELFHAEPGSNSLKVLQAIHEKGVPFVSHYVDLRKFEQHDPEYLKVNPAGQVPALLHEGRVLTESTVINEYIDAVFEGPPLRPADEYLRGQMRIWTKFVDEVFRPSLSYLAWHRLIPGLAASLPPGAFEEKLARIPLREKRDKWRLAATGGFGAHEIEAWQYQLGDSIGRLEKGARRARLAGRRRLQPGRHRDVRDGQRQPRAATPIWSTRPSRRGRWPGSRGCARGPGVAAALAMPNHAPPDWGGAGQGTRGPAEGPQREHDHGKREGRHRPS
ncbi:MAG: glutathione S-transferase family protein [Sphingomonas sp.]